MSYLRFGEGKRVLVILPGISFRRVSDNPEPVVNAFEPYAKDRDIYLFDRKDDMKSPYTVREMAEDTIRAMEELGIRKADFYGASQGGMICQYIAIEHPEMIKKMVIASSAPYVSYQALPFFERISELVKEKDPRSLMRYSLSQIYSKEFYDKYKDQVMESHKDLSDEDIERFGIMVEDTNIYILDKLAKADVKAMVVAATGDKIFGIDPTLQMAYAMNCECVIYDGYSHAVYDEAEDFKERLFNFLG